MRKWLWLILIIGGVLAVDQVSKQAVIDTLLLGQSTQPIPALAPFFQFTRSANTGAAFGILPQAGDIFLVIAVVVVGAMLVLYPRTPPEAWLTRAGFGLVCGGALGNALDRLQHGEVIDFIHYQIPGVLSNVSNLADHAIVFGVIAIFIDSWRLERSQEARKAMSNEQ